MLLEDEAGVVNLIVPRRVYESHRLAVRTAAFAVVEGRLERRENVTNVVAESVAALTTPAPAAAEVRQIEPPAERETGRDAAPRARRGGAPRALLRPGKGLSCKMGCRTYVLSGAVPSLAAMRLRDHKKSLSQHLLGAVDLALDFATLGEYGLEPVAVRAARRPPRRPARRRPAPGCAAANEKEPPRGRLFRTRRNGGDLLSQALAHQVPSALRGLTALFGMGRGVSPSQ